MITNATIIAFGLGAILMAALVIGSDWRKLAHARRVAAKRDTHARRYDDLANEHTHALRGHPQTCWDKDCPKPTVEVHLS